MICAPVTVETPVLPSTVHVVLQVEFEDPEKVAPIWTISYSMSEVKQLAPDPVRFVYEMLHVPVMSIALGPVGLPPSPPQAARITAKHERAIVRLNRSVAARMCVFASE